MALKDIILDVENDLKIINGDLVINESEMQEVGLILQSNQGQWKEHPILGPNLEELIRTKSSKNDFEKRVKLHLSLDRKDYSQIKEKIKININQE